MTLFIPGSQLAPTQRESYFAGALARRELHFFASRPWRRRQPSISAIAGHAVPPLSNPGKHAEIPIA